LLGTCISIKCGGVKHVLWAQTSPVGEIIRSCMSFPHVSKIPTLACNRANSVIIKKAIILNLRHNIFNIHDTEKLSCHMLKRAEGLDHHPNIRQYTSK
jgi:hypothetical protein